MALDADLPAIQPDDVIRDGSFCPLSRDYLNPKSPISNSVLSRITKAPPPQARASLYFRQLSQSPSLKWSEGTFKFKGLDVPYYIAHAAQTNAVEGAISGLKPDHAVSPAEIKSNREHGISTIWLNLPNPGRSLGYMEFYRELTHYFYTSPNSPLYTEFPADTPKMAKGHSTGGGILIDLATDETTKHEYADFKLITGESIFMDNANAARHDSKIAQIFFTAYATMNKHRLPHETLFGLGYLNTGAVLKKAWESRPDAQSKVALLSFKACLALYVAGQTVKEKLGHHIQNNQGLTRYLTLPFAHAAYQGIEHLTLGLNLPSPRELMDKSYMSEHGSPTYGQILETRTPHRTVTDRIMNAGDTQTVTKIILIAGENDPYSSLKPQSKISQTLHTPIYLSPTQHTPLRDDPHARNFKLAVTQSVIPEVQKLSDDILQQQNDQNNGYWPNFDRLFVKPASSVGQRFYAAASTAYNAMPSMPRPSLDQLTRHMPSLFSRRQP